MPFLLIKIVVGTNTITYIYNATGQKVSKIVNEATNVTQTNYLAGGFQYKNNVLQFFPHAEGYVKHEANNYSYVFNYTDHLGNVRVSYSDIDKNGSLGNELQYYCKPRVPSNCIEYFTSSILEENHYYPFGQLLPNRHGSSNSYRYGFNGMEKDDELKSEGNSYDFGARMYDSRIGRWFKIDTLSTKYPYDSPYMFSGNSPISIMDPDGKRKLTLIYDENNNLVDSQVTLVDYTLIKELVYVRDKIEIFGYTITDSQAIAYDYYDILDIEVAVRDKNGKLFGHQTVQKNIKADKRLESISAPWHGAAEMWTNYDDEKYDKGKKGSWLEGNSKGFFKGGIDFYLDDDGSLLNTRGLEKMNVSGVVEKVEVSELMAIAGAQSSMTSKVPFKIVTLDNIHSAGKGVELWYTVNGNIFDAAKEAALAIIEKMDAKKEQERIIENQKKPDSIKVCSYCYKNGKIVREDQNSQHYYNEGTTTIKNPEKKE